jgi:hypothetical protein
VKIFDLRRGQNEQRSLSELRAFSLIASLLASCICTPHHLFLCLEEFGIRHNTGGDIILALYHIDVWISLPILGDSQLLHLLFLLLLDRQCRVRIQVVLGEFLVLHQLVDRR